MAGELLVEYGLHSHLGTRTPRAPSIFPSGREQGCSSTQRVGGESDVNRLLLGINTGVVCFIPSVDKPHITISAA